MNILIVGNVLKDVYLNLDDRVEKFETDKQGTMWLDFSFDASEHHFFNRESSFGGAAISLEVLTKMGFNAVISNSGLKMTDEGLVSDAPAETYRYILMADDGVSYLVPTGYKVTNFATPSDFYDYIYVDRSALIDRNVVKRIRAYMEISPNTKLVVYLRNFEERALNDLAREADLVFCEDNRGVSGKTQALGSEKMDAFDLDDASNVAGWLDETKLVRISERRLSYRDISEPIEVNRVDARTHLSIYSIAAATVLGSFILGNTVEDSLKKARVNVEKSKLNTSLTLEEMETAVEELMPGEDLELIARSLVLLPKGILAADESGGSIHKKFAQMNIPDTYDTRRDYRKMFFTTPDLEKYVNGVILFDETARQLADNGQNFVEYLTGRRIVPGVKVDEGLESYEGGLEKYTKGLDEVLEGKPEDGGTKRLDSRLAEYYQMGLRFAKWRAAFEIRLNNEGSLLTPTEACVKTNCKILAKYALACQKAGLVPIVEPEVVYDGYYTIWHSAEVTGWILDCLFGELREIGVDLKACILKVNMILPGRNYRDEVSSDEVGARTAEVLKMHVPGEIAGVVFLSGGQTPEQATENLAAVRKHGPFDFPVTFSFARALQEPALLEWRGDNANESAGQAAFLARLKANVEANSE